LLSEALAGDGAKLPPRNKRARERERHLLLYLQRLAGKNDTYSEFGPSGWGTSEVAQAGVQIAPAPGIARREAFFERWAAFTIAAAMNGDTATRPELAPRLNPHGRLDDDTFILPATGKSIPLDRSARESLVRCDGRTPAHATGVELPLLADLAERGVLLWEAEVPAMDPYAFAQLLADVEAWRPGAARERLARDPAAAAGARHRVCRNARAGRAHRNFTRSGRALSRARDRARPRRSLPLRGRQSPGGRVLPRMSFHGRRRSPPGGRTRLRPMDQPLARLLCVYRQPRRSGAAEA
jgi:hypothetical protein